MGFASHHIFGADFVPTAAYVRVRFPTVDCMKIMKHRGLNTHFCHMHSSIYK
jgi:hypothetical protein